MNVVLNSNFDQLHAVSCLKQHSQHIHMLNYAVSNENMGARMKH
jgi:hypothetical protein